MLVKVVLLFLLAMVAIAMIGGAITGRGPLQGLGRKKAAYCAGCGRPRIGRGPCSCGRG